MTCGTVSRLDVNRLVLPTAAPPKGLYLLVEYFEFDKGDEEVSLRSDFSSFLMVSVRREPVAASA